MVLPQDLFEKIVLLILTALITGFGVPYVLQRIQDRRMREGKLIDAQAKLLDDLSHVLWRWRYLAKKVVYYAAQQDAARYSDAAKNYEVIVWDMLDEFRTEIGRSRRLVSERAYQRLDALYDYVVHDLDVKITAVIRGGGVDVEESNALARRFSIEVSRRIDDSIDELAAELHLKVSP